jgi:hypothetical protein
MTMSNQVDKNADPLAHARVMKISHRDSAAKGRKVEVLAGYHAVNVGTGNLIRVPVKGISVVNGEVVGLKAGLRIATAAEIKAGTSLDAQKGR